MVGDRRQGWAVLAAMLLLFVPLLGLTAWAEGRSNPAYPASGGADAVGAAVRRQHGRQGDALRHRRLGALGGRHHRGLERLRQLDARLLSRRSAA